MTCSKKAAFLAVLFAGIATAGVAAAAADNAAPGKDAAAPSVSLEGVVGKKLTAIDGSTIALMPSESGLTREIVAPNGTQQKTVLGFINEKLGTVADGKNTESVIGVFRATGAGIEIQYADGSSETIAANSGGGITIESISGADDSCRAWYPDGHSFSVEERKAALAQFAVRLGLADGNEKKTADSAAKIACTSAPLTRATTIPAKAEAPIPAVPAPVRQAGAVPRALTTPPTAAVVASVNAALSKPPVATTASAAAAAATAAGTAGPEVKTVEVRNSEIHPVDAPDAQKGQQLASADTAAKASAPERGASECLAVESDGAHWGFRNHCGYSVQFAYCQMTGNSQLASCRDGALSGSVAANGFGSLIADGSLSESNAVHDFRWVACQGGAGEVIPRLDQVDPPAGRCVH
jgi:hypothetical protein